MSLDREQSKKAAAAMGKAEPEDILSNFVYGNGEKNLNQADDGDSDLDDDEDNDGDAFARPAMSDGEDEVAYFANRSGLSEFKVRRRYTLHPHGRFRACWDVFQILLMTCRLSCWPDLVGLVRIQRSDQACSCVDVAGILVTVPFELCFSEISVTARRDILQSDLFVDAMFAIDILLK